jgi:hypothetical protein
VYLGIAEVYIFSQLKWRFSCTLAISNAQIISGAREQLEGATSSFHHAEIITKCAINLIRI